MTKSTPTPKQSSALAKAKARGKELREWLQRDRPPKPVEVTRSGHGVTRVMQNIRLRPPEDVHRHTHPSAWDRRHKRDSNGAVYTRGERVGRRGDPTAQPGAGHVIRRDEKDRRSVVGIEPKPPIPPRRFVRTPLASLNQPHVNPNKDRSLRGKARRKQRRQEAR